MTTLLPLFVHPHTGHVLALLEPPEGAPGRGVIYLVTPHHVRPAPRWLRSDTAHRSGWFYVSSRTMLVEEIHRYGAEVADLTFPAAVCWFEGSRSAVDRVVAAGGAATLLAAVDRFAAEYPPWMPLDFKQRHRLALLRLRAAAEQQHRFPLSPRQRREGLAQRCARLRREETLLAAVREAHRRVLAAGAPDPTVRRALECAESRIQGLPPPMTGEQRAEWRARLRAKVIAVLEGKTP